MENNNFKTMEESPNSVKVVLKQASPRKEKQMNKVRINQLEIKNSTRITITEHRCNDDVGKKKKKLIY